MGLSVRQNSSHQYVSVAATSLLLLIVIELVNPIPRFLFFILPIVVFFLLYNLYYLLDGSRHLLRYFLNFKGITAIISLLFLLFLCFIPVNEFTSYLSKATHPFNSYRWLLGSLVGALFSIVLLNYLLMCRDGAWVRITNICRALWELPPHYFLLIASLWVFIVTNIFSYIVFEHIPHVQDEIAQFMQAKIFARGSLTAPSPPIPDFFQYFLDNMIMTNRWYSQYPSGHPVLLMVGVLLGIPWIINPLYASFSAPLLYLFVRNYYGEKEARFSVVLYCVSPFVLFMSSSFMNHVTTVFFLLLFLYSANKSVMNRSGVYAVLAGCALGAMGNIRVGDAFAVGVVFVPLFFIYAIRKKMYRECILFTAAVSCMVGILLLYNYATNGDPVLFGYQVRWGKEHTIGFYAKSLLDNKPVFTPLRGIIHTLSNCIALNQNLLEWPFPSLLPIIIYFIPFLFKKTINDYLLLGGALAVPVFYFFYFYQDLCLGPRFYYTSLPFIVILTARSIFEIINRVAQIKQCSDRCIKNAFCVLFLIYCVFCACLRTPHLFSYYSNTFWDVDNKLMHKVQEMGIKQAIIFQESYGYRGDGLGSGFLHNSPWLDGTIIFAKDLGERNVELMRLFPGRQYYLAKRDQQGNIKIQPLDIKSHDNKKS